jgi:hypothetical protein
MSKLSLPPGLSIQEYYLYVIRSQTASSRPSGRKLTFENASALLGPLAQLK